MGIKSIEQAQKDGVSTSAAILGASTVEEQAVLEKQADSVAKGAEVATKAALEKIKDETHPSNWVRP